MHPNYTSNPDNHKKKDQPKAQKLTRPSTNRKATAARQKLRRDTNYDARRTAEHPLVIGVSHVVVGYEGVGENSVCR